MFFQNVFDSEFVGSMIYSDRQYNITFKLAPNQNRTDLMTCWNHGPFDLTGNNVLTINFSLDSGKYYSPVIVTLTSGVMTAEAVVAALNADEAFASWYAAILNTTNYTQFGIKALRPKVAQRTFISNSSAETVLGFNNKAPVAELPSYYVRHTIENANNYPDSLGSLTLLDEADPIDQAIITAAGLDYSNMKEDWQLLRGRAESFKFVIYTYDGSNRLVETLEMPAGALEGDLGKKTVYTYAGAATEPDAVFELPHVLDSADITLATPP